MINNMLSQIRILESELVLPYEWQPGRRDETDISIDDIPLIRNPFPVLKLGDENYLLLEDADLFRLLVSAGFPHIPAQVFSRDEVKIIPEKIALVNFRYENLIHLIGRYPNQMAMDTSDGNCPDGFVPVRFRFASGERVTLYLRHSSRTGCPGSMELLFRDVLARGTYFPSIGQQTVGDVVIKVPTPSAVITMPIFSAAELEAAAVSERLFPPGVIRPLTACRVVSIDFPMSVLTANIPLEEKEAFLRELIIFREQSRRTSYYEGQLYILNR